MVPIILSINEDVSVKLQKCNAVVHNQKNHRLPSKIVNQDDHFQNSDQKE